MAKNNRFNLLLLDEHEQYIDDYSAVLYPNAKNKPSRAASLKQQVKGRIKICSMSIIFVPQQVSFPIMKFAYTKIGTIRPCEVKGNANSFVLSCTETVNLKKNNIVQPYVFTKGQQSFVFSINYVSLGEFLQHVHRLYLIAKLPSEEFRAKWKEIQREIEQNLSFDRTWFESIDERPLAEVTGKKVQPLVENAGRIMVTNQNVYYQPFNNISAAPVEKYSLKSVVKVFKRRHALRHIGIEIFTKAENTSGEAEVTGTFFTFSSKEERDDVYTALTVRSGVKESEPIDHVTYKWQCGLVSNFDYLMYLNNQADRTFNDLTQYPVFPWVIADYRSATLDLSDSRTYRDFTKPVGALNEERLKKFKDRFEQMPEPKFLYGTHYSTPVYVLYYLVRKRPEEMLRLQNGKFDQPDRLFNSVAGAWKSVNENSADLKELIPEFFMPPGDFLINSSSLFLGNKQDGTRVGDTILPPWAKNASDFVRLNREALESEHVSAHIHHWIDLIFGYKQQGEHAVKANNVFYYLTYEGAVDIESIQDPIERDGILAQINEFGQTPSKLFNRPHPKRFPAGERKRKAAELKKQPTGNKPKSTIFEHKPPPVVGQNTRVLLPEQPPSGSAEHAFGQGLDTAFTTSSTDDILIANLDLDDLPPISSLVLDEPVSLQIRLDDANNKDDVAALSLQDPLKLHRDSVSGSVLSSDCSTLYSVSADSNLKIYSLAQNKQLRSMRICKLSLSCCALTQDQASVLIGSWDNNVYLYNAGSGNITDTALAHDDAVAAISVKGNQVLTGSWDSTVKLWQMTPYGIQRAPRVVTESDAEVKTVKLDGTGNIAVAGSADGVIHVCDIRANQQIARFRAHANAVSGIDFTTHGNIISCSEGGQISLFTVKGSEVKSTLVRNEGFTCLSVQAGKLFFGSHSGTVRVWDTYLTRELVSLKHTKPRTITCLCANYGGTVVAAGLEDGSTVLWK